MDIDIPDWLTKEFLKRLLENNLDDVGTYTVEIIAHDVYRRVPKGTNYLSNLLGVKVECKKLFQQGSEEIVHVSLIVKAPLMADSLSGLNKFGVLEREVEAYYELLPKLNEIVREGGGESIMPKCYKCDIDSVVILEDLKTTDYVMTDKRRQVGYDVAISTLQHLAKFHAASVALHEKEPEMVERIGRHLIFTDPMDPEALEILDPLFGQVRFAKLCAEFDKYPETKKYVNALSKLGSKYWEYALEAYGLHDDEFNALNHGDIYVNNMLLLFDTDNSVKNIKFVDFQTVRYASPTIDVSYYIGTSVKADVFIKHYTELTDTYIKNINFYLKKYGSELRFSEESFRKSMEKREIFFLFTCINCIPFMFGGNEEFPEDEEPPELTHPPYPFFEYSQTAKYRKTIVKVFEWFSAKPWFHSLLSETTN